MAQRVGRVIVGILVSVMLWHTAGCDLADLWPPPPPENQIVIEWDEDDLLDPILDWMAQELDDL
jgi:hypothetical protein